MESFETLSEAIQAMQTKGYHVDFNLKKALIQCKYLNKEFGRDEFHVDAFYRFEGDSNPDDSSILYAIQTKCGIKGLLVDAYGVYSDSLTAEMIHKLKIR